jgi:hypothetical protein
MGRVPKKEAMIEIISIEYTTTRKNSATRRIELKRQHFVNSKEDLDQIEQRIADRFKTTRDNVYIRTKDKGKHYPSEAHFMGEKY